MFPMLLACLCVPGLTEGDAPPSDSIVPFKAPKFGVAVAMPEGWEVVVREVDDALPGARLASHAVDATPGLLGAEGDRQYLVLFTNPAETRALGGFIGSYGVLEARQGRLDMTVSGSIADLAAGTDPARLVVDDDGPGIAADDLPHVFERLYVSRHEPVRKETGSGSAPCARHECRCG